MGYKVKKRFIGTQQVRPAGYTPGTNTLAYWKLNGNLNDSSGNNRNLTNAGQLTFATVDGVQCAYCNGDVYGTGYAYCQSLPTPTVITVNIRAKATDNRSGEYARGLFHTHFNYPGGNDGVRREMYSGNGIPGVNAGSGYNFNTANYDGVPYSALTSRNLRTVVRNNSTHQLKIYRNSVLYDTKTFSSYIPSGNWNSYFTLGVGYTADNSINRRRYGRISETIIEQKEWTQEEITEYYNFTKSKYIGQVFEYSYDFRNKTTSQVTTDGWVIRKGGCSFNSYGVRNDSSDWMLKMTNKVVGLQQKMISCKKLIIEFTRYTTGEAAFAGGMVTESKMDNLAGVYQDNRLGDIDIFVDGSSIMHLSGTISGTVKFRGEFDLINKTAALSWNGNSPTTATLTDEIITKIRNEFDAAYVYFRGNPYTSNLGGLSDISIKIEY